MTSRADKVIRFIESYCRVPEGAQFGKPIELAPFQKEFICDIYDNPEGTRRAILAIARKNGKSALIAALLLAHLVGPEAQPNSQIISGAQSRDQAALVFDLACKMVNQSPELRDIIRIVPSSKRLIGLPRNVEYKAIAAEGRTAHGLSPVLAILDEVGQVRGPQDAFIDAITTSQGAHENPLLIAISTQAPTDADMLSQWIDDARKGKDPHRICHLYAADPGAEVMDRDAWKAANPAIGLFRSLKDVEDQAAEADRMPSAENTFRNLVLNQRVNTVSPLISEKVWRSNSTLPDEMDGVAVWGGLDLSAKTDLTALVLVWQTDGVWHVAPHFWAPEQGLIERAKRDRVPYDVWSREGYLTLTPGATVDYEWVANHIAEILEHVTVNAIAYDRWRIDLMRKELNEIGVDIPLIEFGQGYKDMSPAIDVMESELLNGRVAHGEHPVLTMCAMNAVSVQDPAGNRKMEKSKSTGRIDGLVALAMAMGIAQSETPEETITSPWESEDFEMEVI